MNTAPASRTWLSRLACIVLAIVMFLSVFYAVTVFDLRRLTSKSGIRQILGETLSAAVPKPVSLTLAAGDPPARETEPSATGGLLSDWIYERLQETFGEEMTFTREQVADLVEKSTLKPFLAEKFSGVVDDFYAQRNTVITTEEILTMIDENAALLEQELGIVITDSFKQEIVDGIAQTGMLDELAEKGLEGILLERLDRSASSGETGTQAGQQTGTDVQVLLNAIRKSTSYPAAAAALAVYLLCALGYFFACGRRIPSALTGCGIPMLLVGFVYALPTALCLAAPELVGQLLGGLPLIGTVCTLFFRITAPINCSVFGLGLVVLIAGIVGKLWIKKGIPSPEISA